MDRPRAADLPDSLRHTWLSGVRVIRRLGDGRRSSVHLIERAGQMVAVKIYAAAAVSKHIGLNPVPLARYEYQRNLRLFMTPGVEPHVARPIAFIDDGATQAFVQAFVPGVLFEHFRAQADDAVLKQLADSLRGLVGRAHAAGVYDLDLHPNNVMVVPDPVAGHRVVLFDFNNIPVHERGSNPLHRLLFALGAIQPASRDLRRLHLFTDPPGVNRFGTRRQ